MKDIFDQMASQKKLYRSVGKDINAESTYSAFKDAEGTFLGFAKTFNDFRAAANDVKKTFDILGDMFSAYNRTVAPLIGGTLRHAVRTMDIEPSFVEDDDKFTGFLVEISKESDLRVVMRVCTKTNALIAEKISSWGSKAESMRMRTSCDGSTESELEICERKIATCEMAIETLRKRGEAISNIYYNAKKELTKFLENEESKFTPIYTK